MSVTVHSPFNSDHVIFLHVFVSFVPPTNVTLTQPIGGEGGEGD